LPDDAEAIFTILRRHIRAQGRLFFSANIEAGDFGYREAYPETPTSLSEYSLDLLHTLLERAGWTIMSIEGKNPRALPIIDSFLCYPR
jgi:hypothetical protein